MDLSTSPSLDTDGVVRVALDLLAFDGPVDAFVDTLLGACVEIEGARCAALIRCSSGVDAEVVRVEPELPAGSGVPAWLDQSLRAWGVRVAGGAEGNDPPGVLLVDLPADASTRGCLALRLDDGHPTEAARRACMLFARSVPVYERSRLPGAAGDSDPIGGVLKAFSAANAHAEFRTISAALCDEVASRWGCARVSLGMVRGEGVRLRAMSHTEHVVRKSALAGAIESAMDEAIDQDIEVVSPAPEGAVFISHQADALRRSEDAGVVVTLPMRMGDTPTGALALAWDDGAPPRADDIRGVRLLLELITPRLVETERRDRWVGARLLSGVRESASGFLGPTHTLTKLTAMLLAAILVLSLIVPGTVRAPGSFTLVAADARVVGAPFAGVINAAPALPGERVQAGETVLAELDTTETQLALSEALAEMDAHESEAARLRAAGRIAEALAEEARARQAKAGVDLHTHHLREATIVSPIDGIVLRGDLRRRIGAPVQMGETLFEIGDPEALRAVVLVPEDMAASVATGQRATLAPVSDPRRRIPCVVARVHPVGEEVGGRVVFRVECEFDEPVPGLWPGVEGAARIEVGRAPYLLVWTRRVRNWLSMHVWL